MSRAEDILKQLHEIDYPGIRSEKGGQPDDNDDYLQQRLLHGRINQQKHKEERDLAKRNIIFKVEGYESYAHSAAKHEWVATLPEAKRLAVDWTKGAEFRFEEIYISKLSRRPSYPSDMGWEKEKAVAALKKNIQHYTDKDGHLQAKISWAWV